jgi:exosortase F-associated protein
VVAIALLATVYVFQRMGFSGAAGSYLENVHPNVIFVVNRTVRLIVNDAACFILIFVFFQDRKYLKVAFWVFLVELLVILPIYLIIKLSSEGNSEISSPLLSQIHRLVVNPTLMILLMAGFVYQRLKKR